jgi:hypothetical protein
MRVNAHSNPASRLGLLCGRGLSRSVGCTARLVTLSAWVNEVSRLPEALRQSLGVVGRRCCFSRLLLTGLL